MLDGSRFRCSLQEQFETVEGVERERYRDRQTNKYIGMIKDREREKNIKPTRTSHTQ